MEDLAERASYEAIGAAIEVHRYFGPGLLEGIYEDCVCHELDIREIPYRRQVLLPVFYKGRKCAHAYKLDLLIKECLILEVKGRITPADP